MPSLDQGDGNAEMLIDLVFQGGVDTDYLGSSLEILDLVPGGPHELLIGNASTLFMFSNPLACTGSSIGTTFSTPPQPTEPPLPTVDPVGPELVACFAGSYPELLRASFHSPEGGDFEGLWIGLSEGSGEAVFVGMGVDWGDGDPLGQGDQTLVGSSVTDGLLGTDITSGDLNRDGRSEIVVIAPDWDSGVADVFEENPSRMGAVYIVSSCSAAQPFGLSAGASANCLHDTAGSFGVDEVAAVRIEGTVSAEWGPFAQVAEDRATVELEVINDRLLIFAPRFHHPSLGADVGVILVYQLGADADGDGFWTEGAGPVDCDDSQATVNPEASEVCDGFDNDCDHALAEGETDEDGDGSPKCDGILWPDVPEELQDCAPEDPDRYPGNPEVCDGLDNDCVDDLAEGETDEDGDESPLCDDALWPDGPEEDCDDTNPAMYPDNDEHCDGLDNDCDGAPDPEEEDSDGDNFVVCSPWTGGPPILGGSDCEPDNRGINPGATELCDGIDQNCDGRIDETFDIDDDLWSTCAGDCNDDDPDIYPGASDGPEPVDEDCDGTSGWPGGCSCSAGAAGATTPGSLSALLLILGLAGRRRRD
jgi:MYXO-CTERM domain-containing protein